MSSAKSGVNTVPRTLGDDGLRMSAQWELEHLGQDDVQDGVVVTEDTRIEGRNAQALTRGRADLPQWRLDSRTEVFRAEDPKTAYLTARLKGPLDAPDVAVGGLPFQRRAPAPAEAGDTPAPGAPAPEAPAPEATPPRKIKPEDVIKNLLKSLGN